MIQKKTYVYGFHTGLQDSALEWINMFVCVYIYILCMICVYIYKMYVCIYIYIYTYIDACMVPMDLGPKTKHFLRVLFRVFWQEEVQKEGQEGEEQKEEEKGPHNTEMVQTNWR